MNDINIKEEVVDSLEAKLEGPTLEDLRKELIERAKKDIDNLNDVFIEKALDLAPLMDVHDTMTMLKIIADREAALLKTLKNDSPSSQTNIQNNYLNKEDHNAKLTSNLLSSEQLADIYKEFGVQTEEEGEIIDA